MPILRRSLIFSLIIAVLLLTAWFLDRRFPLHIALLSASIEVLDRNGERLRIYTTPDGYWRLPAHITEIDPRYLNLLLAYEDKRFYQHPGIDPLALGRAVLQALRHGRFISGGSTITMQTARLLHPQARTWNNKWLESLRALQLEWYLTKAQILDLYLTLAPYGGNLQGVRAASIWYFGKEPKFLTLAEAALLVALPQAPERRRPDRAATRAQQARDTLLTRLVAQGILNAVDANQAAATLVPMARLPTPRAAPHLSDRLRASYPGQTPLRTALHAPLQRNLEALLARHQARQADGVTLAALILDNHDATVKAYIGSGAYLSRQFPGQIDGVRAIRSPGSTLKPFVYGLAFDAGFLHPETLINDRPGTIKGYAPGNFDHRYQGQIRVREALWASRNLPAIKVLDRVGPDTLTQRLRQAGVLLRFPPTHDRPGLPMVLGGVGMRLEDLTRLYSALAQGGQLRPLGLLADAPVDAAANFPLLSPAAAWYLTDILGESPLPSGFVPGKARLAFKTGTSYGFRDAWAIGYDAAHTVGLWLGRPDNGYTPALSGLSSAVPILLEIFDLLPNAGLTPLLRERPPAVQVVNHDALSAALRQFEPAVVIPANSNAEGPSIVYPPSGSLLEIRAEAAVRLEISAGVAPFHLLIDERPILTAANRGALIWHPATDGAAKLTVLDANGHAAHTQVTVQRRTD